MFGTFVKYQFQHTYDAILAAPVDTEELVSGEALWLAMRASVYGCAPMIVAIFFGLDPSWGMLTVPFINFVAGFAFACAGIAIAGFLKGIENFNYVTSAVITPLFLVAGTFFPLDELPEWVQVLAQINPLYHVVELVRHAVFGWGDALTELWHWSLHHRLRPADVAHRDPRDAAQARRLISSERKALVGLLLLEAHLKSFLRRRSSPRPDRPAGDPC